LTGLNRFLMDGAKTGHNRREPRSYPLQVTLKLFFTRTPY
jgi:hypothetical protein